MATQRCDFSRIAARKTIFLHLRSPPPRLTSTRGRTDNSEIQVLVSSLDNILIPAQDATQRRGAATTRREAGLGARGVTKINTGTRTSKHQDSDPHAQKQPTRRHKRCKQPTRRHKRCIPIAVLLQRSLTSASVQVRVSCWCASLKATQETHRNMMILHCLQSWEESEMIIGYGPPPTKAALTMQLATKDLQQNPEQSQHKEKSAEPWHDAWTHQATIQTPTHTPCTQLLPRHGTPTMTVIPCKTHSMKNIGILSPLLGRPDTIPSGKDTGTPARSSDLCRGVSMDCNFWQTRSCRCRFCTRHERAR